MSGKIYTTKEVAKEALVEAVTIRKWAQILEEKGYIFDRNEKGWRLFTEKDVYNLRHFATLRSTDMNVEEVADNIVRYHVANINILPSDTAIQDDPLTDFMKRQEAFNERLMQRLDQQERYIEESLKKRDKQLMEALKETMEAKKMIAAAVHEKKKWWQFWK